MLKQNIIITKMIIRIAVRNLAKIMESMGQDLCGIRRTSKCGFLYKKKK